MARKRGRSLFCSQIRRCGERANELPWSLDGSVYVICWRCGCATVRTWTSAAP